MQTSSAPSGIRHTGKTREEYENEGIIQPGIAFPSAAIQEHLLIIRLDITGAIFSKDVNQAREDVKKGLKRLCTLFEHIDNGTKRIDQLVSKKDNPDDPNLIPQHLKKTFNFSTTIGFGKGFFDKLEIPIEKQPKKLRDMPDHVELGDVTPYTLGQTDMIIQLGSSKDFVNRWVLENTVQPDLEDETLEALLKKQRNDPTKLNDKEKTALKRLIDDSTPQGTQLNPGQRVCSDGLKLSADEEECVPDIVTAISGWANITDVHGGFQRTDGRNLLGFNDGVSNPKPGKDKIGELFDEVVFTTKEDERDDLDYGTYMVFQKIQHDLDQWRELSLDEQQEWIGRSKGTGLLNGTLNEDDDNTLTLALRSRDPEVRKKAALDIQALIKIQSDPTTRFYQDRDTPLKKSDGIDGIHDDGSIDSKLHPDKPYKIVPSAIRKNVQAWSHVRKANPREEDGTSKRIIFRRGYPFVQSGLNNKIISGLLFVCFQNDIKKTFEFLKVFWLNNKAFPVPGPRKEFTEDEKAKRHLAGCLDPTESLSLSDADRIAHGLKDGDDFKNEIDNAGILNLEDYFDENNNFTPGAQPIFKTDIDPTNRELIPLTQSTGREGLAGPSEHGTVPTGEFLAIVPFGGGYYFVPPIPNKKISKIGTQFF
jgi:Dyp-type peroxidase family